uniref:Ig-like domain-containing protein n=1 Tax=Oryzias sinensis TaxID=183150 RepID=A0A8C7XLB1_9TELE
SPMQDTACKKGGSRAELHSLEPMATTDFIFSGLEGAEAMKVTSMGLQAIQKAAGDSMILNCSYTPGPLDTGELDIEWSVVSPDSTQKDQMLLSYGSSTQYQHDDRPSSGGLSFAAGDPSKGDASLLIDQLSPAHSATYQCKVKKLPGVDMQKTSLVVMVKPSVPECWLQGEQLFGEDVSLHCQSAKGSTPLKYTWRRESMGPMPAAATQNSVTGELRLSNLSQSFAGTYLCEVNNAVGAQRCRINLKASKRKRVNLHTDCSCMAHHDDTHWGEKDPNFGFHFVCSHVTTPTRYFTHHISARVLSIIFCHPLC